MRASSSFSTKSQHPAHQIIFSTSFLSLSDRMMIKSVQRCKSLTHIYARRISSSGSVRGAPLYTCIDGCSDLNGRHWGFPGASQDVLRAESEGVASDPRMEKDHVHAVYEVIAAHFSDTRFAVWPKVSFILGFEPHPPSDSASYYATQHLCRKHMPGRHLLCIASTECPWSAASIW